MLETIRDYARERLDKAGENDALARRHADYHLALLEERPTSLILGPRRRELLAWFGGEEDNFRATLDYLEGAAPQDAARAADWLYPFWLPRGRLVEAQERLLGLVARNDFPAGTRAMLLEHLPIPSCAWDTSTTPRLMRRRLLRSPTSRGSAERSPSHFMTSRWSPPTGTTSTKRYVSSAACSRRRPTTSG